MIYSRWGYARVWYKTLRPHDAAPRKGRHGSASVKTLQFRNFVGFGEKHRKKSRRDAASNAASRRDFPISTHGKIAHPHPNLIPYPFPMQPAQKRRPRGTRPDPLNAARFPA